MKLLFLLCISIFLASCEQKCEWESKVDGFQIRNVLTSQGLYFDRMSLFEPNESIAFVVHIEKTNNAMDLVLKSMDSTLFYFSCHFYSEDGFKTGQYEIERFVLKGQDYTEFTDHSFRIITEYCGANGCSNSVDLSFVLFQNGVFEEDSMNLRCPGTHPLRDLFLAGCNQN
jgi:hypothetical protein